jgi:hypothetical protein
VGDCFLQSEVDPGWATLWALCDFFVAVHLASPASLAGRHLDFVVETCDVVLRAVTTEPDSPSQSKESSQV